MTIRYDYRIPERKNVRADKYQWIYRESSFDPCNKDFVGFLESSGIEDAQYSQHFYELEDQLIELIKKKMSEVLTIHQKEILELTFFVGCDQKEIGKMLNINQSSICKSLLGTPVWRVPENTPESFLNKKGIRVRFYGGSLRKMRSACLKDVEICRLLSEMREEVNG